MRLLADTNIVAQAVRALRDAGYDVVFAGERAEDPGDEALLAEAAAQGRVLLTKDRDIGALVHRDLFAHCGVVLLDDLGDATAECALIQSVLASHGDLVADGAFVRAGAGGVRRAGG